MKYPDFLCIGAHKAGTTWLWKTLEKHPDVFLPMKEIHFFDRSISYPSPDYLAEPGPVKRLLKRQNRTRNIQIVRALLKSAFTFDGDRLRFFSRFFRTVDDQWYSNLFVTKRKYLIKGDITPAYSILEQKNVRKIRGVNPDIKIVFIMRNPLYRDWSAYRYDIFQLGREIDFKEYFQREDVVLRGNYLRTIENYSNCFSEDQILYCFFDELVQDPVGFYDRLCRFLGIVPRQGIPVGVKHNQSPHRQFDAQIKAYLAARHLAQLEKLADKFGGYCRTWYQEAESIVN